MQVVILCAHVYAHRRALDMHYVEVGIILLVVTLFLMARELILDVGPSRELKALCLNYLHLIADSGP